MSFWRVSLGTVTGPPAQGGVQILGSVPQFQEQVVAGFVVLSATHTVVVYPFPRVSIADPSSCFGSLKVLLATREKGVLVRLGHRLVLLNCCLDCGSFSCFEAMSSLATCDDLLYRWHFGVKVIVSQMTFAICWDSFKGVVGWR